MQDKRRTRIRILSLVIFTLILVYIASAWLLPTFSRYIKRTQDEIKAHYTALYFASTGEGKTIAIEGGVGYIDFDLRNYINENVTQRDIVYTITKPTEFYDNNGNKIGNPTSYDGDLHVLDVWGKPQKVAKSTSLYDVQIVENNGEVVSEGVYTFTYEKLGTGAKGKVHTLTCKIIAPEGHEPKDDKISLVVQLSKPYKEVLIINMNISNRLITFSHKEINVFNVPFDKIYVQTADLFAYHKDLKVDSNDQNLPGTNTPNTLDKNQNKEEGDNTNSTSMYAFTSYAFKLTIKWSGYILDELKLEDIHIGTSSSSEEVGKYDTVNPDGSINPNGTRPNLDDGPFIDIKKSTIAYINSCRIPIYQESLPEDNTMGEETINSVAEETKNIIGYTYAGELVIYVPQGSDIFFHFLKMNDSGSIDVKIEAYVLDQEGDTSTYKYMLYDDVLGGYEHIDDYYNLASYKK